MAADQNLLFGLLALQNGLIDQVQLVAAFQAWTRDRARPLADHLVVRGDLDGEQRLGVEAMMGLHLKKHGDVERSLAAVPAGRSTRESLMALGDPELERTVTQLASGSEANAESTASYAVGTASSDGQRFRVLRPHARGGLGAVFVALDEELHREVALKQILDNHADDPTSRARFLLEAEITGGLEHPGIVPVYGLGTYAGGRPFYAMRFIKGDSLKEAVDRFHADGAIRQDPGRRSLALHKLLRRFIDVCNAIDYAHSRGVLHRDLKPGNIIVGKHGETLVVDWGLAKAMGRGEPASESGERRLVPSSASGSAETLPGCALGTPAYMSPEQAEGDIERLGPHSDVYSLGATLYYLLTGKPPADGEVFDVLRAVRRGELRPPRQIAPEIDRALEAVCLKAMAHRPEDRYSAPRVLSEDVERWMADESVTAWREPLSRRARRWMRRNRTTAAAAVMALAVGVVGLGGVAGVQARANQQLRGAKLEIEGALAETKDAKKATDAALAQSEESRKQAQAVSTFLVEAFRSPDPSRDNRQVKVADVLDRSVRKLDQGFAGSQATLGAMLDALGETYAGLGLYDRAVSLHTKAAAVRAAALGPDHADTLTTTSHLAAAYRAAGQLSEAIALHEATLKRLEARLGPDHRDTLISRSQMANAYWSAGRIDQAIALHEATLKLREAKLGHDDPDTLGSRNNVANAYRSAGRAAEAVTLLKETVPMCEAKLGVDHPLTLTCRINLAAAYYSTGRLSDAIGLLESTLPLAESRLGAEHPLTLTCRMNLAGGLSGAGRFSEAIPLMESTLKQQEAELGADHPITLFNRANLAAAYANAERVSQAIPLMESTLRLCEAKLGPGHPETQDSRSNLAAVYETIGRSADAEALRRDVLARRRRGVETDSPALAGDLALLGGSLLSQSRWSEAEPLLREALAIRAKAQGDDWSHYDAMSLLGDALLGQRRFAEAESLIIGGYEGMKAREMRIPVVNRSKVREAAERIVRLYEGWNKPEPAAAWKSKVDLCDLPADVFASP